MPWLKLWNKILDSPKVQMMPPESFKGWINLLCLASRENRDGRLPGVEVICFVLRVSEKSAAQLVDDLVSRGLIDRSDDGLLMHDWEQWQPASDSSAERVRRYREKLKAMGETTGGYTKHRAVVLERDGHACVYCGSTESLCLDHLVPVDRGGDSQPDNLVTACKLCNSGKSGRLIEETNYSLMNPINIEQYELVKRRLRVTVSVTGRNRDKVKSVTPIVTPIVTPLSRPCHAHRGEEKREEGEENPPLPPPIALGLGPEFDTVGEFAIQLMGDVSWGRWVNQQGMCGHSAPDIRACVEECAGAGKFSQAYAASKLRGWASEGGRPKRKGENNGRTAVQQRPEETRAKLARPDLPRTPQFAGVNRYWDDIEAGRKPNPKDLAI